jgi:tripartite-type tricarboxylate transporter receptor subunit TctC
MKRLLFAAVCAVALQNITGAMAETYPSRPIVMVAPLGVGGSTDVIARVMAQGMSQVLGQTIIVENTTGAGGTVGEARIARATPDGYTIGIGQWGTNVANGAIYPLNYDLMKARTPA